jgi:N-acetylglucosamine kinase-like BadF-type ATPase
MILVADSGSSKTDWVTIDKNLEVKHFQTKGLNPFFVSSDDIFQVLSVTFKEQELSKKVDSVYFYGSGCIKGSNTHIVSDGITRFFQHARVEVDDDMVAAAHALFEDSPGIACILGTGANSCKYDGQRIIEKIPTLGYILGDEASGSYFGKKIINHYYKKRMPEELAIKFNKQFSPELGDVLNKVYKKEFPNRYLAGFTHFLSVNIKHPYVRDLLMEGFDDFITSNISKYSDYKSYQVGFAGSIAFHFSEILKQAGKNNQIEITTIIEKPIEGLIKYHSTNH